MSQLDFIESAKRNIQNYAEAHRNDFRYTTSNDTKFIVCTEEKGHYTPLYQLNMKDIIYLLSQIEEGIKREREAYLKGERHYEEAIDFVKEWKGMYEQMINSNQQDSNEKGN